MCSSSSSTRSVSLVTSSYSARDSFRRGFDDHGHGPALAAPPVPSATMQRVFRISRRFSYTFRRSRSFRSSASRCSDLSGFIEHVGEVKTEPSLLERDSFFNPDFFNTEEQAFLIRSCLKKLDAADSPRSKRRRRALSIEPPSTNLPLAQFLPDHAYTFDQVFTSSPATHSAVTISPPLLRS